MADEVRDPMWENVTAWVEKEIDPLSYLACIEVKAGRTVGFKVRLDDRHWYQWWNDSAAMREVIDATLRDAFATAIRRLDEVIHA